jgi:hypothetical protein
MFHHCRAAKGKSLYWITLMGLLLSFFGRPETYQGSVGLPCISLATLPIVFSLYYRRLGKPRWLMLTGLTLVASYLTKLLLLPTFFPIVLALFLLAADLSFGQYRIEIGMYDFDTGIRVPIHDEKGYILGDSILLGNVEIIR